MPPVKLLCAADLHLGRSSAWMSGPATVDRTAAGAWNRLVERAIGDGADAVVLAGDVFDGVGAYYETRRQFLAGVRRLHEAGIPTVGVTGNHDWEALPRFAQQFPDSGFTLLGKRGEWEARRLPLRSGAAVTFAGWSFPEATVRTSALPQSTARADEGLVVGLVHGDVAPASQYHPLSEADLARGADAWVLGHVHLSRAIGNRAAYPGSPQALDFGPGEQKQHGFCWLTLDGARPAFSPIQAASTVRFEEASLEVTVGAGEDAAEAFEDQAHALIERYCREDVTGSCESVQLRLRVGFQGSAAVPRLPAEPQLTRDGRHSWYVQEAYLVSQCSPWEEIYGRDAAGEAARILLGACADVDGRYEGRAVDPSWIRSAAELIDRAAADVIRAFQVTVGRGSDTGDAARPAPAAPEARALARGAAIRELEELLREAQSRRGERLG